MDQDFREEIIDRLARIEEKLDVIRVGREKSEIAADLLEARVSAHDLELKELKIRSGVLGLLGGLLAAIGAMIWKAI